MRRNDPTCPPGIPARQYRGRLRPPPGLGWSGAPGRAARPGHKGKAAPSEGDARTLRSPPHARGKERAGIFWTEGGEEGEKVMNNLNKSAAELRRGEGGGARSCEAQSCCGQRGGTWRVHDAAGEGDGLPPAMAAASPPPQPGHPRPPRARSRSAISATRAEPYFRRPRPDGLYVCRRGARARRPPPSYVVSRPPSPLASSPLLPPAAPPPALREETGQARGGRDPRRRGSRE